MLKESYHKKIQETILPRQSRLENQSNEEFVILARRKFPFESWICHQVVGYRLDSTTGFIKQNGCIKMPPRALASEANSDYEKMLFKFYELGYKTASTSGQIRPKTVCEMNWDFEFDLPKSLATFCKNAFISMPKKNIERSAQAGGSANSWYSGKLPDPQSLTGYVGTSSVDASQLQSSFGGVHEAIQLVNQFDSSLLRSVAFIFNTSGGAYGVYVPWLDEQIKNAEVKELLKRKGFEIEDSDPRFFTAYSKDKSQGEAEIKREIENAQSQVRLQGGNTFGINMAKIMSAARADASESGMTDPADLYDLAVLHLGATMVHEAVHAKGSQSEGPSQQAEMAFTQWGLEIINKKRLQRAESKGEQEVAPLIVNPNARRSWYDRSISGKIEKTAQFGAQFSNQVQQIPMANQWAGLLRSNKDALESMLGAQRQGPKRGKSFEQSLQEQNRSLPKINPTEIVEMMLEKDHDETSPYMSVEELLEERRPKPLAIMIDKEAKTLSGILKQADESYNSTFGWMNNLDLPMSERVITEEQMEDFQNFDWKEVRRQPRYNPEYDRNGIYYRWYEPRMNSPELWDRMVAERGTTSPALRFAQEEEASIKKTIDVLSSALDATVEGKIAGTRFICDETMLPLIDKFYKESQNIKLYAFPSVGNLNGKPMVSLWLVKDSVPERAIEIAEAYASGKTNNPRASDVFEHITGLSRQRKKVIDEVLEVATELAQEMGLEEIYIVDSFPRAILSKESWANVLELNFACSDSQNCMKFGGKLGEKIGATDISISRNSSTLIWSYKGLICSFRGKWVHKGTAELMSELNLEVTPLSMNIYSRDFTINMFVYKVSNGKVYDGTGQGKRDFQSKTIRTYFSAQEVVKRNPMTILRAIKYACKYQFEISKDLKEALLENKNLLFSSCEPSRLFIATKEIMREGSENARNMIVEFGLEGLLNIRNPYEQELN